jgi:hypothetical protein
MAENSNGVVVTERMLIEAAKYGDTESLTIWARQGVRVTTEKPLFGAVLFGHLEATRLLVQMGANVSHSLASRCGITATPLNCSAKRGCSDMVLLLVTDCGADINQANASGDTPLVVGASERGNQEVLLCLVEVGAEVRAVNSDGDSALLMSVLHGHYSTVRYLLEEADANMDGKARPCKALRCKSSFACLVAASTLFELAQIQLTFPRSTMTGIRKEMYYVTYSERYKFLIY